MSENSSEAPQIDPFERAKRRFLEQLPEDQQRTFLEKLSDDQRQLSSGASIESLFYKADVLHKEYESSSTVHAFRETLRPFFNILENYSKALDVASNIGVVSTVLAPLWGGLRVILQIAQQDDKSFKELVEMLRQIGLTLPRFRDYHRLFPNHPRLMLALSEALANIFTFCQKVRCCFGRSDQPNRWSVGRIFHKKHSKLRSSLPNYLDDFIQARGFIEEEANMAHMIEDGQQRQQQVIHLRGTRMEDVLSKISTYKYWTRHEQLQDDRHEHTAEWLGHEPLFQTWLTSSSRYFTCFGIPGSGKSILASKLVDQLGPHYSRSMEFLGYYFCDFSDPASLQFSAFVVSLVRQALHLSPWPKDLVHCIIGGNPTEYISLAKLSNALQDFLVACKNVFLVIDGIDELPANQQDKVFDFIRSIYGSPFTIKIFISCRPGLPPSALDPSRAFSLTIQPHHVQKDISRYVEETINAKVQNGRLRFDDPDLRQEVTNALSSGAKEMFIWVKFQIKEICKCLTDSEIREALQDLPDDLATLFSRILSRVQKSHRSTANATFRWITCAYRPLDLQELYEAIAIEEGDDHFHWDRVITDSNKFLKACGDLVVIQVDGTVRLAHETIRQFFLQKLPRETGQDPEEVYPADIRRFQFSFEEADNWIGRRCITFLHLSNFDSKVAARKHPRLEIPTATLMPSALIRGSLRNKHKGKISLVLPEPRKKQIDRHQAQFKILVYIQEFWALHLRHITEDSLGPYSHVFKERVSELVFTREYLFPIHPWKTPSYLGSFVYKDVYEVRITDARATNIPLFIWSLEHGVYYLQNILQRTEIQFQEMVLLLLSYDMGVHQSLLQTAAKFGPTQVHVLMRHLEKIDQALDKGLGIPIDVLLGALRHSSESTQQSLLDSLRKTPTAHSDSEGTCLPITFLDSATRPFPWHPEVSIPLQSDWTADYQEMVCELFRRAFKHLFEPDLGTQTNTYESKTMVLQSLFHQVQHSSKKQLAEECLTDKCLRRKNRIEFFRRLVFDLEDLISPELNDYLGKATLPWIDEIKRAWRHRPPPSYQRSPVTENYEGLELCAKLLVFYGNLQWEEQELPQRSNTMETIEILLKDGATASELLESLRDWPPIT